MVLDSADNGRMPRNIDRVDVFVQKEAVLAKRTWQNGSRPAFQDRRQLGAKASIDVAFSSSQPAVLGYHGSEVPRENPGFSGLKHESSWEESVDRRRFPRFELVGQLQASRVTS
jgi:hypothetical protein